MARVYFSTVDAVGRRFRLESDRDSWIEVVGVVGDVGPDVVEPHPYQFYLSHTQSDAMPTAILARTSRDATIS